MAYSDEYMEATAEAYAFVIQRILCEAVRWEGFTIKTIGTSNDPIDISLYWTDSNGVPNSRLLWEKEDSR
jgi:hypothetical protein